MKSVTAKIVNHDFRYHAEIQFETEHGFDYTNAKGNTLQGFLNDLKSRLNKLVKSNRDPKVVEIIDLKYNSKIPEDKLKFFQKS
tara:strand:+ start:697 stop:948 length:252 start_codon:yes stop_codon:yes gene_type:complete